MAVWDPFREMEELRREIDRAFDSALTTRRPDYRRTAFLPGRSARQYPLVNLAEDAENVYVEALAPGLDPNRIEITVQGTMLTISGEKPAVRDLPAEAIHRSERSAGTFVRAVELPRPVKDDQVSATYKHGLLLITLPKHEAAKPKRISISAG